MVSVLLREMIQLVVLGLKPKLELVLMDQLTFALMAIEHKLFLVPTQVHHYQNVRLQSISVIGPMMGIA